MDKKRRNDYGQLSREEYEALMDQEVTAKEQDRAGIGMLGDSGERLSGEEMKQMGRKIIRAKRPGNPSEMQVPFAPSPKDEPTNPFASVKLVAGGAASNSTAAPAGTFLFGKSAPTGTTKSLVENVDTPNESSTSKTGKLASIKKEWCEFLVEQDKTFQEAWRRDHAGSVDQSRVLWKYSYYRVAKDYEYWKKSQEAEREENLERAKTVNGSNKKLKRPSDMHDKTPDTSNEPKKTTLLFGKPSNSDTSNTPKSTFPFGKPSTSSSTVPPFSAGNTSSASGKLLFGNLPSKPDSASKALSFGSTSTGGFSFGASSNTSASTGLSFAAPASSSTVADNNPTADESGITSNETKTPTVSENKPTTDDTSGEQGIDDKAEKQDDPDWDDIESFEKLKFYRMSDPKSQKWKEFAFGELFLQVKKDDSTKNRMVMRDKAGLKVLVNMMIGEKTATESFRLRTQIAKGMKWVYITIQGLNDEKRGIESFNIKGDDKTGRKLAEKLKSLGLEDKTSP